MRLSDLFRGRLTWRELGVLLRQLPASARTWVALGQEDQLWGLSEHLQAMTVDELRTANWQRGNEGQEKSRQSKPPKPIPRPCGKRDKQAAERPERKAARTAALERAAARRSAIAAGEII